MSKHIVLQEKLTAAKDLVSSCKKLYFKQKDLLTETETNLIEAKINQDRIQEELEAYELEFVIENSIEEEKEIEIAAFAIRLPALLKQIENEKPLTLLTLSDLDTVRPKGYR